MTTPQKDKLGFLAYTLTTAAGALNLSPTHIGRLLDREQLTEADFVCGSGRYVTAESLHAYAAEQEARRKAEAEKT